MEEETAFDEDHNTEESIGKRNQGTWDNRVEYILSLSGYTTGSSDFWRFPYLIWRYGGGTFILAYIFSAAVVAVPVYYLEVTVAQFSGRGMFDVWEISPIMKGLGIGMFIINFEYLIIAPTFRLWIMQYIGYSFMSPLPWKRCDNPWNTPACVDLYITLPANSTQNISQGEISAHNMSSAITAPPVLAEEEFFLHKILQVSGSVYDLGTFRWDLCLCLLVFTTLCAASVIKDVKSIGKVMYVVTILPLLLLLVIFVRTLLAPGSGAGMRYFLTPDITKLWDLELWVQAGFAAAFSLCTANGGNIEIGSRARFRTNLISATVAPCVMDVFGSIFTSMVIYSVIGVMAHESGMPLGESLFAGNSAAFVAFTRAFSFFPLPNLWLVIFFLAFLVATSDIMIMYDVILKRSLQKYVPGLKNRPKTAFVVMFVIAFLVNLPFCSQAGAYMYQIIGWYAASMGVFVMASLECIIFMWIYGGHMLDENIRLMNGRTMPNIIRFAAAFICPVLFIVFLVLGIVRYKPPVFGSYHYPRAMEGIGILISLLPMVPLIVCACLSLYRNRKTALTKKGLGKLFQPSVLWEPCDVEVIDEYQKVAAKPMSWSQTAYYNLTGRQREKAHAETTEQACVMTKMI